MKIYRCLFISGLLITGAVLFAQDQKNLAEKLGYPSGAKLLIVHADDLGLAQSVNAASITAFEKGGITSGSIMVPCPWFQDFAAAYSEHPGMDVGIHITLTAEWENYRWGGVSSSDRISTLLDQDGYLFRTVEEVAQAEPPEVEMEIRAQIEKALAAGINLSHLDTHMGSVLARPEFIQIYLKLSKIYSIPVFLPRMALLAIPEELRETVGNEYILVDRYFMLNEAPSDLGWADAYREILEQVGPGLNQVIVHLANDNAEMRAICVNHPDYGSVWRQNDLDFVTGKDFQEMLKEYNIQLVSWNEIKAIMP